MAELNLTTLTEAINAAGGEVPVAEKCGVSRQAVRKWLARGLPRTEWTGETTHAKNIAKLQKLHTASAILKSHGRK
jgi:hypothetical protein